MLAAAAAAARLLGLDAAKLRGAEGVMDTFAQIREGAAKQVVVVDIDNGNRLVTYAITGQRGTGVIGINGAAAHLIQPGDLVILIAYATLEDAKARTYQPRIVFVDADNKQIDLGSDPAYVPADAAGLMSPR